nr:unnamed protein product [Digitaria exilis]
MAGASRKEEERNERIVRGLLKLPPNRRCINCNGLGPQYVCTSFWTFVCVACSGIHREFTHRVKSVSMSTFSSQEVEALQKGGNQVKPIAEFRARESFLKDFDTQKMRLPDSSNIANLREFIKAVYVERRYAGGRFSERPPRDKQRTLSGGNIDSISLKPGKSSLSDLIFEDDNVQRPEKSTNAATSSFLAFSDAISAPNQDVFNSTAGQKHHVTIMDQSLDLFANMPAETPSADKVIPVALSMDNAWWATFDTPPEQKQPSAAGLSYVAATSNDREVLSRDLFSFESNDEPTWFQSSKDNPSVTNLSTATSLDPGSSQHSLIRQPWSVFDSSSTSTQYPVKGEPNGLIDENSSQEVTSTEQMPLNPFDLPFDTHSGTPDLFMDVSSLQEALPNTDLPAFLDGLPEAWFSSSSCAYVPSASHGGLPWLVEQAPNSPLR